MAALAVVTVQTVAPGFDGYRRAAVAGADRRLAAAATADPRRQARPPPALLARRPDARLHLGPGRPLDEEDAGQRADGQGPRGRDQVHLLPLDGGEARRLTDLPRGVEAFEWSPDGSRLVVVSASHGATHDEDRRRRGLDRAERRAATASDYRFIDRLDYMLNGKGFTYDRIEHLWLVDVGDGTATPPDRRPDRRTPSRPGRRTARGSRSPRTAAATPTSSVAGASTSSTSASRAVTAVTARPRRHVPAGVAARRPDDRGARPSLSRAAPAAATTSGCSPRTVATRHDRAVGTCRRRHDLMPGSGMGSDLVPGEVASLVPSTDGRWLGFTAPVDGAYELWRIAVDDGAGRAPDERPPLRLGLACRTGRRPSAAPGSPSCARRRPSRPTCGCSTSATRASGPPRRLTSFNAEVLGELELREPVERHVDRRRPRHPGLVPARR